MCSGWSRGAIKSFPPQGILADEMHVRAVHGVSHAASWCGIGCLSPYKPFRRVDIKVPAINRLLPFCLNDVLSLCLPALVQQPHHSSECADCATTCTLQVWAFGLEATAINHFIGSGPFARALRYW